MNMNLDNVLASTYKSTSQKIRVMSEFWVQENLYCPCCGCAHISKLPNNSPVADFLCEHCGNIFELKSKKGKIGKKIVDGCYQTALERITSNKNPNLMILLYSESLHITDFAVVPKFFFVPNLLEKRRALSDNARRAGWTGCNILISDVPTQGKINVVEDGDWCDKDFVLNRYRECQKLFVESVEQRGWLFDVLQCVNLIEGTVFTLQQMYSFVDLLRQKHPNNNNVKDKIRQQLQILRDRGIILFMGDGKYLKITAEK